MMYKGNINILDVSQTIVDGFFTMTMSTDFTMRAKTISQFATHWRNLVKEKRICLFRVMPP